MDDRRNHARPHKSATFWGTAALVLASGAFGFAAAGRPAAASPQQGAANALVFDGVTVIDVLDGKLIPAQRVTVVGNRIKEVGAVAAVKVPRGAQIVDARGKYLIPGLWDMHTHSRRSTDFFYPLFIANGVTGIRDGWSEVPLDTLLLWRREILAGTRVGPPRQFLAGPALDERRPCKDRGTGHVCVADSADARHVVDSLKAAGADYIKTYGLGKNMYFVVAAEARRLGIPFGGHLTATTAIEASDSGAGILDHVNSSGDLDKLCLVGDASVERCKPVAEHFRRNGTWWVPTLTRTRAVSTPVLGRLDELAAEFWDGASFQTGWLRDSTAVLHTGSTADSRGFLHIVRSVDLPIMAGTDAGAPVMDQEPPGFALHAELAMYVAQGLTPLEALQTATINPAKFLHGTDSLGTVAPGKLADLVLLDADPIENITNITTIRAVVANGRYYDRAALNKLLADVQAKAKKERQH